ncbi:MAG: two-component sensor histidine kinase [Verrucomicrobiales bacterium]|jgi:two-component sensor histidine kinase
MKSVASTLPAIAATEKSDKPSLQQGGGSKHRRLQFSLRSYAIGFSCCIVIVAIGIFGASMLNYMSSITHDELKNRGRLHAVAITGAIGRDLALAEISSVIKTCSAILDISEELAYITVTDRDGTVIIMRPGGKWSLDENVARWKAFEIEDDSTAIIKSPITESEVLHYAHPIIASDTLELGWVHVGLSAQSYHENMSQFKTRTVTMALAALAFGIPASLLFGRMLTRPITRLQNFAENVAEGNLDSRVETGGSKEIANLAETMNWMTGRLADSRSQMKDSMEKEASLREKEILLREIHHRVKNNMQILGGLIRIQCRTLESGEARDVLMASETRIRSMALLHQKLYQSDSISEISFGDYVGVLVGELRRLYAGDGAPIEIANDVPENFDLGLDTALPCGLIVNELVSNSFKYAFPDGAAGTIRIGIVPAEDGRFSLVVGDDGIGLPAEFDLENARSLGLRLVNMLVEQLQGTVAFESEGGCRFIMNLVSSSYTERT